MNLLLAFLFACEYIFLTGTSIFFAVNPIHRVVVSNFKNLRYKDYERVRLKTSFMHSLLYPSRRKLRVGFNYGYCVWLMTSARSRFDNVSMLNDMHVNFLLHFVFFLLKTVLKWNVMEIWRQGLSESAHFWKMKSYG